MCIKCIDFILQLDYIINLRCGFRGLILILTQILFQLLRRGCCRRRRLVLVMLDLIGHLLICLCDRTNGRTISSIYARTIFIAMFCSSAWHVRANRTITVDSGNRCKVLASKRAHFFKQPIGDAADADVHVC